MEPGISDEMTGRPDEQVSSLNNDSTKKPLTSMELAKRYGYIGCLIKQIGTTYNEDGTSNNYQFPELVTDLIIEFVKDDLFKKIPLEKLTRPPLNFEIPVKGYLQVVAHNPIKPEIALAAQNLVLWNIENNSSYELPLIDKPSRRTVFDLLAYSPQGKLLVGELWTTSEKQNQIYIWNLTTKQITHSIKELLPDTILFTHDENQLVIDNYENIVIWDLTTNKLLKTSLSSRNGPGHTRAHITRSLNGKIFAHTNEHGIVLWNLNDASEIKLISGRSNGSISFGRDETQRLYACGHSIFIDTDNEVQPHPEPIMTNGKIDKLIYCPRIGKYFFTTEASRHSEHFKLNLLDLNSHKELISRDKYIRHIFSDDGSKLVLFDNIKYTIVEITYIDLVPDLNKFTIDQLRVMATKEDIQ
jgi:hypothetical protein